MHRTDYDVTVRVIRKSDNKSFSSKIWSKQDKKEKEIELVRHEAEILQNVCLTVIFAYA